MSGHPWRVLGALGALLIALALAAGSGAVFTTSSANPSNAFAAGTLSIANTPGGTAILTASGMYPGDTLTGSVDTENSGSQSGAFTLEVNGVVNTPASPPLSGQLNLSVTDCGLWTDGNTTVPTCGDGDDVVVYGVNVPRNPGTTGKLGDMRSDDAANLGTYAAGARHRLQFTVTLPGDTSDSYQGTGVTATFRWSAAG